MKTFSSIAFFAAFIGMSLKPVSAGCFTSGDDWQDRDAARNHVEHACRSPDGTGAFQGSYLPGQAKSLCIQHSPTQRFEFRVQNTNTGQGFDLADADCVLRLQNEINACAKGGDSTISGWNFVYVLSGPISFVN